MSQNLARFATSPSSCSTWLYFLINYPINMLDKLIFAKYPFSSFCSVLQPDSWIIHYKVSLVSFHDTNEWYGLLQSLDWKKLYTPLMLWKHTAFTQGKGANLHSQEFHPEVIPFLTCHGTRKTPSIKPAINRFSIIDLPCFNEHHRVMHNVPRYGTHKNIRWRRSHSSSAVVAPSRRQESWAC